MGANGCFSRTGLASSKALISEVFLVGCQSERVLTYRKTIAWSSARLPSLVQALPASSSASPIALPDFPPSGPFVDDVYVLSDMRACDESFATGRETWKLGGRISHEFDRKTSEHVDSPTRQMGCQMRVRLEMGRQ